MSKALQSIEIITTIKALFSLLNYLDRKTNTEWGYVKHANWKDNE